MHLDSMAHREWKWHRDLDVRGAAGSYSCEALTWSAVKTMKAKAKKPIPRARKQPVAKKSVKSAANGLSSPYGYRVVENEWLNSHPQELRKCIGEYVIVEGTEIIAHGTDPGKLFEIAKKRGIKTPYIFFVEAPLPPNTYRIGLL
jgi:hypothetical protein